MNCANHPEAAVTAYCQNCGKGLCSECTRTVQGNVYCEPCLAARMPGAPGIPPAPSMGPSPGLATLLGFIPGVGAMYNGQYIKAIVHVIVFVVLIGLTNRFGFFGFLIAFWVLYQVFDAHQTAKARRDGLPLPDPFGLNDLGNTLAGQAAHRPVAPGTPPGVPPGTPGPGAGGPPPPYAAYGPDLGEQIRQRIVQESARIPYPPPPPPPPYWGAPPPASGFVPGTGYAPPAGNAGMPAGAWAPGNVPPPMAPEMELERARREPIGAIILILLGMLFLFNTLGFFSFNWINHGWPWIVIGIAVWLLARRSGAGYRWMHHPMPPGAGPQDNNGGTPGQPPSAGGER